MLFKNKNLTVRFCCVILVNFFFDVLVELFQYCFLVVQELIRHTSSCVIKVAKTNILLRVFNG